ncbi:MAG: DEAD/DEAH box helicase family protein [Sorangiineae bacterium]|nr:DEAD/DEAH box helicase family protein [Polyangiaceae bacterium]MEB2324558.1 DEAD/DEAH box helicase family protein [Sorangiineae bacterium]
MPRLTFASGTLELRGAPRDAELPSALAWDARAGCFRAPASAYADIVRAFHKGGVDVEDAARGYQELAGGLRVRREPRPFQREALVAWRNAKGRGVVVLPTGAGKSHVAVMAIDDKRRSALVIAPTLDLVRQWYDLLRTSFGVPVGVIGGGEHDVQPLTVSTYDSAYIHMENIGARFGVVVFDECHHLPGETYSLAARLCLAPFRLGLSATPERADGRDSVLDELIGPVVYRKDIVELSGNYLAAYDTERLEVELSPEERVEYEEERAIYLEFVRAQGIRMGSPRGFNDFIMRASRGAEGRRALDAYRRQRELAFSAPAKLELVGELLRRHPGERALIFTLDNATAYRVSRRFLIPAITHQTKVKERSEILARFASGEYDAVVTSKVLNEGVDVPEASLAIVISGSGSVREHVQRLGRILRQKDGKRAVLYELVSAGTAERYTSERRREHDAYR